MKDSNGNSIYDIEKAKGFDYYIKLQNEKRARKLGTLNWLGIFEIKRDREKHLFEKLQAYGFNDFLLRTVLQPDMIVIIKEKWRTKKLKTTVETILREGQYLHFLTQGFEKQIFLPLTKFENE